MNGAGKSDSRVVPTKEVNKGDSEPAELLEGRRLIKENAEQDRTVRTQGRGNVSPGLLGVREAARRDKQLRFTALLHHVTGTLLEASFYELKKEAAPGVDQVTWRQYESNLPQRIKDLHEQVHGGSYRAQPSRRVYLPKPDGGKRPIGIAVLEDKIVQRAVARVLESIYEEDFLGFSYGFRPEKNAHQALDALTAGIVLKKVNWIVDADIRGFFDNLEQERLLQLIEQRVGDPRVLRLIRKWLKAGVSEQGEWSETKVGTPQGAVISPLLANIYLHYVLDSWVNQWRKEKAVGDIIIVRYADDFVLGFQHRGEAERFLKDLGQRLRDYGLELHPNKTRLIEFGRFAAQRRERDGRGKPETFNFLGFTHICGRTHKTGKFTVKRKTISKRKAAKIKALKMQLRQRMHEPIAELRDWLGRVVQGYFNYHAVPGNLPRLQAFRYQVLRTWWRALRRRSQRRRLKWKTILRWAEAHIPKPAVLHPYPLERFCATHPR